MISNLKVLRQAANLTQKELAEKTGVSQQKISELERNPPSYVEAVANICRAVGCSFEELFGTTAKLNRCPTADRCDTATSSPVRDNDQTSASPGVPENFIGVPVEDLIFGAPTSRSKRSKKYYVQLKSIDECLSDPYCAADIDRRSVYGIKKTIYEELAARPAKALCDGIRFYVADDQDIDFDNREWSITSFSSWLVAPRFVKYIWEAKPTEKDIPL